jgi:mono/diheme cytochrome c family protein
MQAMTRTHLVTVLAALATALATPTCAADITASYEGSLTLAARSPVLVAAALRQTGSGVGGTLVLELPDPALAGIYWVSGRVHGRRVRLGGANATGTQLRWRARVTSPTTVRGRLWLHGATGRWKAVLALTRRTSGPPPVPPEACDDAVFRDEVMVRILVPVCAQCHVAGGLAEASAFRVTASDRLATLASALQQLDAAAPLASRLLQKPLATLPHGGGQQLVPGSAQADLLTGWVQAAVERSCAGGGPSGPRTGAEIYAAECASCHGADAGGLDGRPNIRCRTSILDAVRNGRGPDMPAFPTLGDADVAAVQDHLRGLCGADPSGADLYAANCASCHGGQAGGGRNGAGVDGPDIRCKDAHDIAEKVREGDDEMPPFPELDATAIARIASWVRGFCP